MTFTPINSSFSNSALLVCKRLINFTNRMWNRLEFTVTLLETIRAMNAQKLGMVSGFYEVLYETLCLL